MILTKQMLFTFLFLFIAFAVSIINRYIPLLGMSLDEYMQVKYFLTIICFLFCLFSIIATSMRPNKKQSPQEISNIFTIIIISIIIVASSFPRKPDQRERFRCLECENNLKKIWVILNSYIVENHGLFPCKLPENIKCPSDINKNGYKYCIPQSNDKVVPIVYDNEPLHNNCRNILYSDGSIKSVVETEF